MPESIKLIKELISYVDNYQKEVGNSNIKEFSSYLNDRLSNHQPPNTESAFDKNNFQEYKSYQEVEFSTLLTNLYRFAKHYIKKAFLETEINTIDEFGFLASLLRQESLLKKELINQHLLETSSGSEILKRLLKNGLVQEIPDKKDKRAKRVSITSKGRTTIISAFDDMHKVSQIIIGNLNGEELNQALNIMNKLSFFHHHIHDEDKNTSLHQLHSKYVSINEE